MTPSNNGINNVIEIYGSLENAAMVTIAPEIDGALEAIHHFVENNVIVSLGLSLVYFFILLLLLDTKYEIILVMFI